MLFYSQPKGAKNDEEKLFQFFFTFCQYCYSINCAYREKTKLITLRIRIKDEYNYLIKSRKSR